VTRRIAGGAVLLTLALPVVLASPASAHPLGNFTVNAAAAITVTPEELRIDYALDVAEIPTFQLRRDIDPDGDGPEPSELATWATHRGAALARGLRVSVDGHPVPLTVASSTAALGPGLGGLEVLRLDAVLTAEVSGAGDVVVEDRNDRGRVGWREITASGAGGIGLMGSTVPAASPSRSLRSYPQELLSSPPSVRTASFSFGPGQDAMADPARPGGAPRSEGGGSALSSLVAAPRLSAGLVILALAVALGVGALHALAPGHGKTITAAYLAGSSAAGIRQTIRVALAVAAMHTASVLVVGLILVAVQSAFPAERIYPWLGAGAGAAALGLGVVLLVRQVRHRRAHRLDHGHPHGELQRPGLAALAASGGLLPSPTAVVVLLGAFALGRAPFGLALVVTFGLGLAVSLALVGVLATRVRGLLERRLSARVAGLVPMGSAAAIAGMGVVLTARAVAQL
jgi:ABC-type nickel/cobalt efflux system permease component RcnA